MSTRPNRYHAFLLRLWRINHNDEDIWHASLEDSRSGEKHGFSSLEALIEYLRELIGKKDDGKTNLE